MYNVHCTLKRQTEHFQFLIFCSESRKSKEYRKANAQKNICVESRVKNAKKVQKPWKKGPGPFFFLAFFIDFQFFLGFLNKYHELKIFSLSFLADLFKEHQSTDLLVPKAFSFYI